MKTESLKQFLTGLGIDTRVVNEEKGVLEIPALPGLLVAVSETREKQLAAFDGFRELSSKSGCTIASCVRLDSPYGSTVVPGIGRVPVFTVFSGRLEDTYKTGGHRITNSRAAAVIAEVTHRQRATQAKTEYLSWLVKSIGQTRPRTLADLQELMIEANAAPGSEVIPAIGELAIGRGTRTAVLTITPEVEFGDTEPVVCESSYCLYDLERLQGEMTSAQAHVINKMVRVFEECVTADQQKMAAVITSEQQAAQATQQALQLMRA